VEGLKSTIQTAFSGSLATISSPLRASNVTFRIDVNKGEVYMYFLRSRQYSLGNAWCWVNDDYKHGTELKGYWDDKKSVGSMKMVAHDLDKGEYDIHCTLLSKSDNPDKGNHFRIISVFSG
jgi:hypothetical protein